MGLIVLLIVFATGWAGDGWRSGLVLLVPIAGGLTALCLITTNNPSFTEVESGLTLSLQSVWLNFLFKLGALGLAYTGGRLSQLGVARLTARRASSRRGLLATPVRNGVASG